jgi:hypothetical protein
MALLASSLGCRTSTGLTLDSFLRRLIGTERQAGGPLKLSGLSDRFEIFSLAARNLTTVVPDRPGLALISSPWLAVRWLMGERDVYRPEHCVGIRDPNWANGAFTASSKMSAYIQPQGALQLNSPKRPCKARREESRKPNDYF